MKITPIGAVQLPKLTMPSEKSIGTLTVTALALYAISNIPKADALGHFWKHVDRDCYNKCKDSHGVKGQVCFWACMGKDILGSRI